MTLAVPDLAGRDPSDRRDVCGILAGHRRKNKPPGGHLPAALVWLLLGGLLLGGLLLGGLLLG